MLYNILAGMGEMICKGTIAAGKIAFETSALLGEVIVDTFSQGSTNNNGMKENKSTYEYWKNLSYLDQKEYFENNEYLKDYIQNDYYPNDREMTARHVQHIADNLNKEFTNKYDSY